MTLLALTVGTISMGALMLFRLAQQTASQNRTLQGQELQEGDLVPVRVRSGR